MSEQNNQVVNSKTSRIKALHEQGLSTGDIAKQLDIRYQFAYNVLSQAGLIEKSERKETKSAQIKQLHQEGKSVGDISRALHIPYQHAYNVLRQAGMIKKRENATTAPTESNEEQK